MSLSFERTIGNGIIVRSRLEKNLFILIVRARFVDTAVMQTQYMFLLFIVGVFTDATIKPVFGYL